MNPSHLELGTQAYNVRDMIAKRRSPILGRAGATNPQAKLSDEAVREIRALRGVVMQRELAARFGVTQQHVSAIQSGDERAH